MTRSESLPTWTPISSALEWTVDAPTDPGFYWFMSGGTGDPTVVLLKKINDSPRSLFLSVQGDEVALSLEFEGNAHLWAGPISPPKMPGR